MVRKNMHYLGSLRCGSTIHVAEDNRPTGGLVGNEILLGLIRTGGLVGNEFLLGLIRAQEIAKNNN